MAEITTLFWDLGGVVLTNGWDRHCRRTVVERFDLDYEEFRDRHELVSHDFETGRIGLDEYLTRTVFYRERAFTREDFFAAMKAQSRPLETMALVDEIVDSGTLLMATLNNESRPLNDHRIAAFDLRSSFSLFLSSCYLGVKKPEPQMYRLAFELTQRRPEECLFIDDRSLNLECARDEGLDGVLFTDADSLRADLTARGVLR